MLHLLVQARQAEPLSTELGRQLTTKTLLPSQQPVLPSLSSWARVTCDWFSAFAHLSSFPVCQHLSPSSKQCNPVLPVWDSTTLLFNKPESTPLHVCFEISVSSKVKIKHACSEQSIEAWHSCGSSLQTWAPWQEDVLMPVLSGPWRRQANYCEHNE